MRIRGAFVFTAVAVIGIALSYATPYVNGRFLDFLMGNRSERDAVLFALLVAAIGILSALFSYYAGVLSIRITSSLSFDLLREAVLNYERGDYLASRASDSAHTTQQFFTDSNVVSSFVLSNFISAPLSVVAIPVVLFVIWSINPLLMAFSVVLLLVYLCVITGLRKTLYKVTFEKKEADSTFYAAVSSQLNQILNIQLTSSYENSEKALDCGFSEYLPKVMRSGRVSNSLVSLDGLFTALFQAVILIISGVQIINGAMTIGEYTIVGAYFGVLFKTLKNMISLFKSYQDAKASWNRTSILVRNSSSLMGDKEDLLKLDKIDRISVSNLNYSVALPDGSIRKVLDGFSFEFAGPGTYCIAGKNGCGKTTLLYLMLGLYPSIDMVSYNGIPKDKCDLDYMRSETISCCPQQCIAPDMTVGDFLEYYGTPFSRLEHMRSIPSLESGVIEVLKKRCTALSGGELRRVYLWSAISRKPSILVLDEPTTGLDAASRNELVAYIRRNQFNQTMVIVSHDEEIVKATEFVVRLDEGPQYREC